MCGCGCAWVYVCVRVLVCVDVKLQNDQSRSEESSDEDVRHRSFNTFIEEVKTREDTTARSRLVTWRIIDINEKEIAVLVERSKQKMSLDGLHRINYTRVSRLQVKSGVQTARAITSALFTNIESESMQKVYQEIHPFVCLIVFSTFIVTS